MLYNPCVKLALHIQKEIIVFNRLCSIPASAAGLAIGLAVGYALDNLAIGLALGIALVFASGARSPGGHEKYDPQGDPQ